MHQVLFAHGTAVGALRAEGVKNIGIVTNLQKCEPATDAPEDQAASDLFDGVFNRWYLGGLYKGQYPADVVKLFEPYLPQGFEQDMPFVSAALDWAVINYYSLSLMAADPTVAMP